MPSSVLLSIITTLLIITICCQSKNNNVTNFDCLPSEKEVLMRLQASSSDDPFNKLSSWKANSDCCTWQGIECDNATGHVVMLDMSGVNLSGTKDIIKVLNKLPSLVDLRLSGTGLGDTNLPHTNCVNRSTLLFTNIQYLDLSSNSFGENSSFCFLRNMTSLSFLDLSSNSLHKNSDWVSDLLWDKCHLKSLDLGENQFYGDISVAFRNLSGCWGRNLESIHLNGNEFDGHLPEELGEMKQLTKLDVSRNMLSGHIPSSIGNLKALRSLDLSNNQLGGEIPVSLGQLSNLESINTYHNALEGTLSEAHFAKLSRLVSLFIGSNSMLKFKNVGGDNWVPPFHQLRSLYIGSVDIGSELPQWIQTQKSLQELDVSHCGIRGKVPQWFGSLMNLTLLDLNNNQIEGTIPELLSSAMTLVKYLDLSGNLINGSIPESLCRMKDLFHLDLSRNHLSGHLPNCVWESLYVAKMSSNQLSGAIPDSIGGAYLTWLKLDNNSLTGQIPFTLKKCTSLSILDVGDNKLSGNLPQWIGNDLLSLGLLRLRNNKFDGDIPSSYCQLSRLQIMDIAHNHLTGNIPRCFGNLSGMISAVGDFNAVGDSSLSEMMKGALLEYTFTTSKYLVNLDLSSNRLFGEIPSELTNLTGLNGLNLSHNHLRGTIPQRIGDMMSLESFDLSSNSLSGTIPQSLSNLTYLSFLNLSNNDLSGPILTGPQLQTLNDSSNYEGNPKLCGGPLPKKCHDSNNKITPLRPRQVENDDGDLAVYLYASIASGVATGFCGFFGILAFKRSWGLAFFQRMDVLLGKLLGR